MDGWKYLATSEWGSKLFISADGTLTFRKPRPNFFRKARSDA